MSTDNSDFQLVDDFLKRYYKDHFGRAPRTLLELETFREQLRHKERMRHLKTLEPKLALLDPFLPALAARGVKLAGRDFSPTKTDSFGVVIRIPTQIFERTDDKLLAALLAEGFREVKRRPIRLSSFNYDVVTLKHGRALYVELDTSPPPATQSPTTHSQETPACPA